MDKGKKGITLKSQYDIVMEQFEKEGRVKHFSDQENAEIVRGLMKAWLNSICSVRLIRSNPSGS